MPPRSRTAISAGLLSLLLWGSAVMAQPLMKGFVALMFTTVVGCAVLVQPDMGAVAHGLLVPSIPLGSGPLLLGVMGGVGGSVTLLSYSY